MREESGKKTVDENSIEDKDNKNDGRPQYSDPKVQQSRKSAYILYQRDPVPTTRPTLPQSVGVSGTVRKKTHPYETVNHAYSSGAAVLHGGCCHPPPHVFSRVNVHHCMRDKEPNKQRIEE